MVEALLGSTAKLGEVIVLGMITQLKEVSDPDKYKRLCFVLFSISLNAMKIVTFCSV